MCYEGGWFHGRASLGRGRRLNSQPTGEGPFGAPGCLAHGPHSLPFPGPTGHNSAPLGTFLEMEWFLCLQGLHLPNRLGPPPAWAGSSCSLSSLLRSFLFLSLPLSVSASLSFLSLPSPFAFLRSITSQPLFYSPCRTNALERLG